MTLAKHMLLALLLCLMIALPAAASPYAYTDRQLAELIAGELTAKFNPKTISVTVNGSTAYVEARGSVLDGVRVDSMKLSALLARDVRVTSGDVDALATLIQYSKGELTLLEKDVHDFFSAADTKGFTDLHFDFTPQGFKAGGVFSAKLIFTIRIRLAASGILALKKDGIYLEDVAIFVENLKQGSQITDLVTSKVNPLLEFKTIPFPVSFGELRMTDDAVFLSGKPEKLSGGVTVTK